MSSPRGTWARMTLASKAVAVALPAVVLAVGVGVAAIGGGLLGGTAAVPAPTPVAPTATRAPLPPEPTLAPNLTPAPTPTPAPPQADPLLGVDGRLTVLLLGSDYRPAHPGNRTDAVLVVSVDPASGAAAGFSIPRDTVQFPLPESGRYAGKLNAMYQHLHSRTGDGGGAMKAAVARAYGIEVDSYVFIGFEGFRRLVRAIGGVEVTLDKAYYDPYYWVNARTRGWGLPRGTSHLNADEALIFARSRKGDNDFGRARRQQQLILAVLDKVRDQGVDELPRLLRIARDTVRTDLPLDRAPLLFEIIATTDIGAVDRVVFGPRQYATARGAGSFAPDLDAQRAWIEKHFPPARPFAAWPIEAATAASPAPAEAAAD